MRDPIELLAWLLVSGYYGTVCWVDIRFRRIPLGLIVVGWALGGWIGSRSHGWQSALAGGLLSLLFALAVYGLGLLWAGRASWRSEAVVGAAFGFGDVLLASVGGLLLGWPLCVDGLLISTGYLGLYIIARILLAFVHRQDWRANSIPLAPFFAAGALTAALIWLVG